MNMPSELMAEVTSLPVTCVGPGGGETRCLPLVRSTNLRREQPAGGDVVEVVIGDLSTSDIRIFSPQLMKKGDAFVLDLSRRHGDPVEARYEVERLESLGNGVFLIGANLKAFLSHKGPPKESAPEI